ncbi:hypothetical protein PXV26_004433 [Escherichia coli]|uniref:hypothetical protein n=1 Tax=Atlantibacter hermannii TaxID=565 RepID=UPI00254C3DB9|nr:hypothetical protein [Atlantibacter hermannii]ELR8757081.1 hypothetical protein [Escherichia coli]MDJ9217504.1 hypothetical protein [Salmonella enterica]
MKWLQVIAGYLITGAASAGVVCLFVLTVVLFCQVAETGSAADWVASVANIMMAITAALAFIVARNWLPQLTTQEGYKLAIRLVNEYVLPLDKTNPFRENVSDTLAEFLTLSHRERLISCEKTFTRLWSEYEHIESQVSTVKKLLKQMETYGVKPAPDRKPAFEAMVKALNTCAGLVKAQWLLLSVAYHGGPSSEKMDVLLQADTYGLINRLDNGEQWEDLSTEMLQELDNAWTSVTENQQAFLGTDSQIGKLFKVKK